MSYISYKVVVGEMGDSDRAFELDSEALTGAAAIIQAVEDLEEGQILIVSKVVY